MTTATRADTLDEPATVLANHEVAPGFYRMRLRAPETARRFRPGQFFQLQVHPDGVEPLLRRPFAPSEVDEDGFAFLYAVVGEGTEAMTRLGENAAVRILAPLGRPYDLCGKGDRAVLVGGGCGAPSLRFLGETLRARDVEVHAVLGARSACSLLERDAFENLSETLVIATDDGSAGRRGHAVAALEHLLAAIGADPAPTLYACGPHPMLKGVAALATERGLDCQVSLEERMACGFGACMGCAVAIKADEADEFVYRRVCVDGPVFDAREILW